MIHVSDIQRSAPISFKTVLQEKVYQALGELQIPFERVDTDEAITMEDCQAIDARLQMKTVKTLFLCNRQQTDFYLFITAGDKPFRTKDFSAALNISRVSFAPADCMEAILGTRIGAATIFSCLLESSSNVQIVLDKEILADDWYGCSDGTTTGYMKLRTEDVCHKLLPFARRIPLVIEV